MRGIVILFIAVAAIIGGVMLFLAVRDGGFEEAGRVMDREVGEAGVNAKKAVEQAGDAVERATGRATEGN